MALNRIMRGLFVRRGLWLALLLALSVAALSACGGQSGPTTAVPDKEADVAVMNEILGRQMAAVKAYGEVLPRLRGRTLALGRQFQAQEQEHVDGTIKGLRGIGGKAEPAAEEIEVGELKTGADALRFLYTLESATIDAELNAITKLTGGWPRALLASTAANQAQHLVLIRRALGAKPLNTVPSAFEAGTTPAP
jgi:hypothetical protein